MNAIGWKTLFVKEVRRFLKVPGQTLLQPVVMTSLYFLVFGFSLGGRIRAQDMGGVSYARFIVPGLVMLGLIQNALLNTSSSMFVMKLQGTIVDLLVAPLGTAEILSAFVLAGVLRGLLVGFIVYVVAGLFTGFAVAHVGVALAFSVVVAATFALLGLSVAIAVDKFEQLNVLPTFVVTPLTFLGGVFYSVRALPSPWDRIAMWNPVLYMVEGLRYGLLGASSLSPWTGLAITSSLCAVAGAVATWMIHTGYRLRN